MNFTPKTEEQLIEESLWPAAEYDFDVVEAHETTSKSGNDMIVAELVLYKDDGRTRKITDYLTEAMGFKLRHLAETCGILDLYDTGSLSATALVGRSGRVKIRVKQDAGYSPSNAVVDYVKPEAEAKGRIVPPRNAMPAEEINDEVPF